MQHDPIIPKPTIGQRCNIWVHDEGFSKDEVVLNLDLFPDVKAGELMAILSLKTDSGVRDFQDKAQSSKVSGEHIAPANQAEPGSSNPTGPVPTNGSDVNHDVDNGRRYLFVAKDMTKEMKTRQKNLEISVAKHVADVFGLKHRSNVLVTSVSTPAFSETCIY